MATSTDYFTYVEEALSQIRGITYRRMMGEYCVDYQGKVIGLICDNTFFLKPTPSVQRMLPNADRVYPYEGSKTLMVVVESIENTELLKQIMDTMYDELPEIKKRIR